MALIKVKCSNCGHVFMTEDTNKTTTCPLCGFGVNVFDASMSKIDQIFQKGSLMSMDSESVEILEYIHAGDNAIKNNDFESLKHVATLMDEQCPNNFWTICFNAILDLKIVFTEPLNVEKYILNEQEMQEDLKARIYHSARYKYAVCPQRIFDKLNSIYPDVPNPNNTDEQWVKCPTIFDMKMNNIEADLKAVGKLKEVYLPKLLEAQVSSLEGDIIQNIYRLDGMLKSSYEELKRYDKEATEFVQKDYEKTKNPGNKPLFAAFLISFIISVGLIIVGISNYILGAFIGYDSLFAFVTELISVLGFIVMVGYGFNGMKFFSNGHPIYGLIALIASLIFVIFGITVAVQIGPDSTYQILIYWGIMIAASIVCTAYALPRMIRYKPYDVRTCKTYIGNYQALIKNDFYVSFPFQFVIRG